MQAAQQRAGDGGAQINQCLHGLLEIAKICVIFAGGYFGHWLLLRRDADGRKRVFLALMTRLKSEVDDIDHPTESFGAFYQNQVHELRQAAAISTGDFSGEARVEFERLVSLATAFKPREVDNARDDQGRHRVSAAYGEIIRYVNAS